MFNWPQIYAVIKSKLLNYYTKAEVDSAISTYVNQNVIWKKSVPTFSQIFNIYQNPQEGWTVSCDDTNAVYRYDMATSTWIEIDAAAIPYASQTYAGKIRIGTPGEVTAGTNALVAVTPATLKALLDTKEGSLPVGNATQVIAGDKTLKDPNTLVNHERVNGLLGGEYDKHFHLTENEHGAVAQAAAPSAANPFVTVNDIGDGRVIAISAPAYFTLSAGQSVLVVPPHTVGTILLFVDGVLLKPGLDFSDDGTNISFGTSFKFDKTVTVLQMVSGDQFRWKSPVNTYSQLPQSLNMIGDVRLVIDVNKLYTWKGTVWEATGGAGGDNMPILVNVQFNVNVPPMSSVMTNFVTSFGHWEIKSLAVNSDNPSSFFDVNIYDAAHGGFKVYSAADNQGSMYDLLILPYADEDGTSSVHVEIINKISTAVNFTVRMKGTSLA